MGVIYMHMAPNGKCYIGQTTLKNINNRWRSDGSGYKKCTALNNAIKKYGWQNFKHKIIEDNIQTREELNKKEKYYIEKYNSLVPFGYNISKGGSDCIGQSIAVICFDNHGNYVDRFNSMQDAVNFINKDRTTISNAIKRQSTAGGYFWVKEIDYTEEFSNYIINNYKDYHKHFQKVYQYDYQSHNLLNIFNSQTEAAKYTKVDRSSITDCINKRNHKKSAGGYIWSDKEIIDFSIYTRQTNSQKIKGHGKKIVQLDKNKQALKIFDTITSAAIEMGGSKGGSNICKALKENCLAYGYYWEYLNNAS